MIGKIAPFAVSNLLSGIASLLSILLFSRRLSAEAYGYVTMLALAAYGAGVIDGRGPAIRARRSCVATGRSAGPAVGDGHRIASGVGPYARSGGGVQREDFVRSDRGCARCGVLAGRLRRSRLGMSYSLHPIGY